MDYTRKRRRSRRSRRRFRGGAFYPLNTSTLQPPEPATLLRGGTRRRRRQRGGTNFLGVQPASSFVDHSEYMLRSGVSAFFGGNEVTNPSPTSQNLKL